MPGFTRTLETVAAKIDRVPGPVTVWLVDNIAQPKINQLEAFLFAAPEIPEKRKALKVALRVLQHTGIPLDNEAVVAVQAELDNLPPDPTP